MKICTKCGLKEQDNSAIFCKKCGNELTSMISTKYHPTTREELDDLLDRDDVEYSEIDVSKITDMSYLFAVPAPLVDMVLPFKTDKRFHYFNSKSNPSDLMYWDVSNVENMEHMFDGAISFNQPIGNWNVSNIADMRYMFKDAMSFNQPIGDWDVSNVTNMQYMFCGATSFNQPIGDWNVSYVKNINAMFCGATSFNQPLDKWNVSNVKHFGCVFDLSYHYRQVVEKWGPEEYLVGDSHKRESLINF